MANDKESFVANYCRLITNHCRETKFKHDLKNIGKVKKRQPLCCSLHNKTIFIRLMHNLRRSSESRDYIRHAPCILSNEFEYFISFEYKGTRLFSLSMFKTMASALA